MSKRFLFVSLISLFHSFAAIAQPEAPDLPGDIQALYETAGLDVADETIFGDHIDIDTGAISFVHVDVDLPGNSALPVRFGRSLATKTAESDLYNMGGLGNWQPLVPSIRQVYLQENGPQLDRCTGDLGGAWFTTSAVDAIYRWQYWTGLKLIMGGQSKELLRARNSPEYSVKNPRLVSKQYDLVTCVADDGSGIGETFKLTTAQGISYAFKKRVEHDLLDHTSGEFDLRLEIFYATRIEDAHGNWVEYEYTGDDVSRIHANDGREITITYTPGGPLDRVSANGRHWDYSFSPGHLSRVDLPDGSFWDLSSTQAIRRHPDGGGCMYNYPDITFKHPSGATAVYGFRPVTNGRTEMLQKHYYYTIGDLEHHECAIGSPGSTRAFVTTGIGTRTVTVPGDGAHVWTWDYDEDWGHYQGEPKHLSDIKTRTVTYPDGHEVVTHVNRRFGWQEGKIEKVETFDENGNLVQTVDNTHIYGHLVGTQLAADHAQSPAATYTSYQTQSVITRGSDTYTTVTDYETDPAHVDFAYGSPRLVTRTSSVSSGARTTQTEYQHLTGPWILGLATKVTQNGKEFDRMAYNGEGLVTRYHRFGVKKGDYTYYTSGDQAGLLATYTDTLGRLRTYSQYKRGQPGAFAFPEQTNVSQTIDDNGWVTSVTNAKGVTTSLEYDPMGRVTKVDRPSGWADTLVSYANLGGGIVQTATRGNTRTTRTLDGYYRPVEIKTEDLTGHSPARYVTTEYDAFGRTVFTARPALAPGSTNGTATQYDVLGRVTKVTDTADGSFTRTQYLHDNRVKVFDPLNYVTTTRYEAWGAPETEMVRTVIDPTTTTTMTRDVHGNITQMSQTSTDSGFNVSVDRRFWYDDRLRLCRHRAPEFGDELFRYDNGDRLRNYSRGEPAADGCVAGASEFNPQRVVYYYDDLDRETKIDYRGFPYDIYKTYDANGNVTTLNRGGISGGINWTYTYNDLDLLEQETLEIDARIFSVGHGYNATGQVTSRSLPGGTMVQFDPNGFGEPRSVTIGGASVFTNTSYHPNGAPEAGDYGNGRVYWQNLNPRQLTSQIRVSGLGSQVLNNRYYYDSRKQIDEIEDLRNAAMTRTFGYDGRGRLVTANGPWGAGTFSYDGLDNIRAKALGPRTVSIAYDGASNLVQSVLDSADGTARPWVHDLRGNVTDNGQVAITYDFAGQPLAIAKGAVTQFHRYDGHKKRVRTIEGSKTTYWVYSTLTGTPVYQEEVQSGTSTGTHYVAVPGATVRLKAGDLTYTHLDHQGSPVVATAGLMGGELWRERYTPFGEKHLSAAANDNDMGYTGHIQDSLSGLTYMQARYYDPIAGRFLSTDPIGYQDQLNLYAYVRNDPVNATDPTGEFANFISGAIGGGIGAVVGGVSSFVSSGGDLKAAGAGAAGGFVSGAIIGSTGQVSAGLAAGSATSSVITQLTTGDGNISAVETAVDVAVGVTVGKVVGDVKVPSITSGQNSYSAVAKSNATKLKNGTISSISPKSAGKAVIAGVVGGSGQEAASIGAGVLKDKGHQAIEAVSQDIAEGMSEIGEISTMTDEVQ